MTDILRKRLTNAIVRVFERFENLEGWQRGPLVKPTQSLLDTVN